jgi:3',5'-cyclic-AMP phosphodiesterase
MPVAIAQLTDLHLGAPWCEEAAALLAATVATVREVLGGPPDAVLVTGDIANDGTDGEYEQARALLDVLEAPLYPLPGNHDDRDALRCHFAVPQDGGRIHYAATVGPLRIVTLDTKREGTDAGELGHEQLGWLERTLSEEPHAATILAMHHPPILTGMPAMDAIGLPAGERAAIAAILDRHAQVQLVCCGHVHRTIAGRLGGATVLVAPSTCEQLALDLVADEIGFTREPPSFAIHTVVDGRIVSHVQPVAPPAG